MKSKTQFCAFVIMASLALLLLKPIPDLFAADMQELYRQGKYVELIEMFQKLDDSQHNADSRYFLALSYAKTHQFEKSKAVLMGLLGLDPDFYAYKIQYDLDLFEILQKTDLKTQMASLSFGQVLSQNKTKMHQIVSTQSGVFLYWNGLKILLADPASVTQAGFLDDTIYYVQKGDKKGENKVTFYSGQNKRVLNAISFQGELLTLQKLAWEDEILLQTTTGYELLNQTTFLPLAEFQSGGFDSPSSQQDE